MNLKCNWNDESSYALLRDYGIWPYNKEDGLRILKIVNKVIDFDDPNNMDKQRRQIVQASFNKEYEA